MSNILNYQSGFTFAPPQGMPVDDALVTFTSSPLAAIFNHARFFKLLPQIGEAVRLGNPSFGGLSGGGGASANNLYLSTTLPNNLSASVRSTWGGATWILGLSGGTMRYDIPWMISFKFRNFLATSPLIGIPAQRMYVGSDAGRQLLRFERCAADNNAYPPFTRGIGFEITRHPALTSNNLHRIKLFARDGTSTISGTYTETPYVTAGLYPSNSISKIYNIIIENTGTGVVKAYWKNWEGQAAPYSGSVGNAPGILVGSYANINSPFLVLSGKGVPKDNGYVSMDWYHIEQAFTNNYAISGGASESSSSNQFVVDRPLIYFGSLSSLYNY